MAKFTMNSGAEQMTAFVRDLPENALQEGQDILLDVAIEGQKQMETFISTRGTGWNGHTGRIETGQMLDAVDSQASIDGTKAQSSFGWGINGSKVEDYYRYQEEGFVNTWSGKQVPPMHALLDSFVKMREKFYQRVRNMVK